MTDTSFNGEVITANVIDCNEDTYFVQAKGITLSLPKNQVNQTLSRGMTVRGFAYLNMHQQWCMTTNIPRIGFGHYAFGTVTGVQRDLGVFVNIGLPDKDIAVSSDFLPRLTNLWPQIGDRLMIALTKDKKDRLWGKLADATMFQTIARPGNLQMKNKNITGTIYRLKIVGSYLLTDDYHIGFIHPSEREVEPRLGEVVHGRVIGIGQGGILNISLRPRGYETINDDAQMILAVLQRQPNHTMHFSDKSSATEIKDFFGISKSSFKRALGHLYKQNLIEFVPEGTHLIMKEN